MERDDVPPFAPTAAGDPMALVVHLAAGLTDADRAAIAFQDWGRDVDLHRRGIDSIADGHRIPSPLLWHPLEVLELTRWSEESRDAVPEERMRLHRQRAFCCAVLATAAGDPNNGLDGINQSLVQLAESLQELPATSDEQACDLLTWLIRQSIRHDTYHPAELALLGLGLLHFALALPRWSDADLLALVEWIEATEEIATGHWWERQGMGGSKAWLLSATPYDQLHHKWRALAAHLPARLADRHGRHVAAKVREIARKVAEGL